MAKIPFGDYVYISPSDYELLVDFFGESYGGLDGYTVTEDSNQAPAGYYIPVANADTEEELDFLFTLESYQVRPVLQSVQGVYSPYL